MVFVFVNLGPAFQVRHAYNCSQTFQWSLNLYHVFVCVGFAVTTLFYVVGSSRWSLLISVRWALKSQLVFVFAWLVIGVWMDKIALCIPT